MKPAPLPDLECACAAVRRVSRLVTQFYAQEMGEGIEPTQFALLTVLESRPGCIQSRMVNVLGVDKTTLSRNLRVMKKNRWIDLVKPGDQDRRQRGYRLTSAGRQILAATKPRWKGAQTKLQAAMTAADWENMQRVLGLVAKAALEARNR